MATNKKQTGMKCLVYVSDTVFATSSSVAAGAIPEITVKADTLLGGQRNATLNRDAETIDATSKDTEGNWMESLPGFKSWSVETEACFISSDKAYGKLEDAFLAGKNIYVLVIFGEPDSTNGTKCFYGEATITSFGLELPYNELVTYGLTLNGSGALNPGKVKTISNATV